jgi:hypothetical protein
MPWRWRVRQRQRDDTARDRERQTERHRKKVNQREGRDRCTAWTVVNILGDCFTRLVKINSNFDVNFARIQSA